MIKSVLIGLDGSPSSEVAVELALQWGTKFNALLVGLGIVDDVSIYLSAPESAGADYQVMARDQQLIEESRQRVKRLLNSFAERCLAQCISVNCLEDTGLPYEEILRESQRFDLVLFGHETHFRYGTADQPDTTLWQVLKRVPRPVVIAPRKTQVGNSVVIAYNGSLPSDRALQAFQSSGLDLGEEVCVIGIDDGREGSARQADRAVEFLRLHQINAVAHSLGPVDSIAQTILEEVQRRSARLLVMGAYGHSALREFILGSVTKAVLKDSPAPVFLCH